MGDEKVASGVERGRGVVSSGSTIVADTGSSVVTSPVLAPAERLAGRVETAAGVPKKVVNDILVEATVAGETPEVALGKCEDDVGVLTAGQDRDAGVATLVVPAAVVETSRSVVSLDPVVWSSSAGLDGCDEVHAVL